MYLIDDTGAKCSGTQSTVPWHVALLLGGRSCKYIFSSGHLPKVSNVSTSVSNCIAKASYSAYGNKDVSPWRKFKAKKHDRMLPIAKNTPHTFRDLLSVLRSKLHSACMSAHQRHKFGFKRFSNRPLFVSAAFKWLERHGLVVAPTDKDGGYAIADLAWARKTLHDKLASSGYVTLRRHELPTRGALRLMQRALKNFGALYSDGFYEYMWSEITSVPASRLLCPLNWTIKTHKDPPSVRLIHAGGKHLFAPISAFCASEFRKEVKAYDHIFGSTDAFLAAVSQVRVVGAQWSLVTGDIKDFFTSGRFLPLIEHATSSLSNSITKDAWQKLLECILCHQFVESSILPGVMFQCTTGSGIGLNLSAEFCDLVFTHLAESNTVLDQEFREQHGLVFYGRYRDDIFMIYNHRNREMIDKVFCALNNRCDGVYQIELESISSVGLPFLDVFVFFRSGALAYSLHRKVTCQRVYLHSDSFHHPSVHRAWPIAEISRIFRRCSGGVDFRTHRGLFCKYMHRDFLSRSLINACATCTPLKRLRGPGTCLKTLWLVVQYHPALRVIESVARQLSLAFKAELESFGFGSIRVSWSKGAKNLTALVQAHNQMVGA